MDEERNIAPVFFRTSGKMTAHGLSEDNQARLQQTEESDLPFSYPKLYADDKPFYELSSNADNASYWLGFNVNQAGIPDSRYAEGSVTLPISQLAPFSPSDLVVRDYYTQYMDDPNGLAVADGRFHQASALFFEDENRFNQYKESEYVRFLGDMHTAINPVHSADTKMMKASLGGAVLYGLHEDIASVIGARRNLLQSRSPRAIAAAVEEGVVASKALRKSTIKGSAAFSAPLLARALYYEGLSESEWVNQYGDAWEEAYGERPNLGTIQRISTTGKLLNLGGGVVIDATATGMLAFPVVGEVAVGSRAAHMVYCIAEEKRMPEDWLDFYSQELLHYMFGQATDSEREVFAHRVSFEQILAPMQGREGAKLSVKDEKFMLSIARRDLSPAEKQLYLHEYVKACAYKADDGEGRFFNEDEAKKYVEAAIHFAVDKPDIYRRQSSIAKIMLKDELIDDKSFEFLFKHRSFDTQKAVGRALYFINSPDFTGDESLLHALIRNNGKEKTCQGKRIEHSNAKEKAQAQIAYHLLDHFALQKELELDPSIGLQALDGTPLSEQELYALIHEMADDRDPRASQYNGSEKKALEVMNAYILPAKARLMADNLAYFSSHGINSLDKSYLAPAFVQNLGDYIDHPSKLDVLESLHNFSDNECTKYAIIKQSMSQHKPFVDILTAHTSAMMPTQKEAEWLFKVPNTKMEMDKFLAERDRRAVTFETYANYYHKALEDKQLPASTLAVFNTKDVQKQEKIAKILTISTGFDVHAPLSRQTQKDLKDIVTEQNAKESERLYAQFLERQFKEQEPENYVYMTAIMDYASVSPEHRVKIIETRLTPLSTKAAVISQAQELVPFIKAMENSAACGELDPCVLEEAKTAYEAITDTKPPAKQLGFFGKITQKLKTKMDEIRANIAEDMEVLETCEDICNIEHISHGGPNFTR